MNKSILTSMVVGKLACSMPSAYAEGVSLDEGESVVGMLTLPTSQEAGQLHVESAAEQSIDFIVKGIPQDSAVQIFLAYSKSAGFAEEWSAYGGEFELDSDSMKLLAGVTFQPFLAAALPAEKTDLGDFNQSQSGIVLPVAISDLKEMGEEGDAIYFQVMVIPLSDSGVLEIQLAQTSEVDKFIIDRGSLDDAGGVVIPPTSGK